MEWGAISASGTGDLVKIDGTMDKKVYHNILVRHGVPSGSHLIGPGFIFKEVNDPKHSSNYCRNYLRQKESAGTLKLMDWPTRTPSSKFGASWKINWTDLLYIQRKAFGLSCRRHGIKLVLKFSGNILTLCQRDVLL